MRKITMLALFLSTLGGYSQYVRNYKFSQTSGAYTELTTGTVLGNETSDAEYFTDSATPLGSTSVFTGQGFPIGFNFTFNGYVYDRFAVNTDGWISLGSSALTPQVDLNVTSSVSPLSSIKVTTLNLAAKIAGLGMDLKAQTGSSISYKTIGTAPNQILVVQWKGYKRGGVIGNADNVNFQIKLYQTSNKVEIVYGSIAPNNVYLSNSATPVPSAQIGLRADPGQANSVALVPNFINRTSTGTWLTTVDGISSGDAMVFNGTNVPSNGLTFAWNPPTCNTVSYLFEDFENYSNVAITKGIPDCWSKVFSTGTGDAIMVNSTTAPMSAVNRLKISGNASTTAGQTGVAYVVLPAMSNLTVGATPTNRLRFNAYSSSATGALEIGYLATPGDISSFTPIQASGLTNGALTINVTTNATAKPFVVAPINVPANVTNLVLRNKGVSGGALDIYIDDLVWEPNPASVCTDVSTLTAVGFTQNSMKLSWTKGTSDTGWQYVATAKDVLDPNSITTINDVVNPTIVGTKVTTTVPGLSPSTGYRMWVRSKCTDGSFGAWIGSPIFFTTGIPTDKIMENFDASSNLPANWSKVTIPGQSATFGISTAMTAPIPSPSNAVILQGKTTTDYAMIALPPVSNLAAGTHKLKFSAKASLSGTKLEIGWLDDIADASTFHSLDIVAITATNTAGTVAQPYEKAYGAVAGASNFLAIRNTGDITNGSAFIDNLSWEPNTTTCNDITNLTATATSSNSVTLGWTAGGASGESWQYAIGSGTPANPFALTPVDVPSSAATGTSASTTIGNLAVSAPYRVWVRSKCTNGSFGGWIGPVIFSTTCPSDAPFVQDFNSMATALPGCWSKVSGNASITTITFGDSSKALVVNAGTSVVPSIVALPGVTNIGNGQYRLKMDYGASATTLNLELGYMVNVSDPKSFTPIVKNGQPVVFTAAAASTIYSQTVELPIFTESEILAFRNTTAATGYVNAVTIEKLPTCEDISNLKVTALTDTTISIDWDAPTTQNKWQYAYTTDKTLTTPPKEVYPADTISEKLIEGLTANTSYKIWVQSKCGEFNVGSWSAPVTVTTTCPPTNVITENFEGTTNKVLPACWTKIGGSDQDFYLNTLSGSGFSTKAMAMSKFSGQSPIIAMPPLSNTSANYVLKFDCGSDTVGALLEVGYLQNVLDYNSFQTITTIPINSNTEYQREVVTLTTPIKSNLIAFRNANPTNCWIDIDNVSWGPADTVVPACATNIKATPNANCGNFANTISWDAVSNADGYKLTIGTTQGGHEILDGKSMFKLNYTFSGEMNTKYYYSVKPFNAVGIGTECPGSDFTTNANGCYCVSTPSSTVGKGITDVQLGATNFKGNTGSVYHFDYTSKPVNFNKVGKANLKLTCDSRTTMSGGSQNLKVWVDFNKNFNFEESEAVYTGVTGEILTDPVVKDASFDLPLNVPTGLYMMRVLIVHPSVAASPCYSGDLGMSLDFKINLVAPVANDDSSANLPMLTVGKVFADNAVTGTNVNATGSVTEPQPTCGNYNGADVWYKAIVPASGKITFEVNTASGGITNTAAAVYSGTPASLTLLACDDSSSTAGDDQPKISLTGRTANETLYLRVWSNGGNVYGPFKVSAYNDPALGVDIFDKGNLAYYPNPVKDVLNVSFDQEISNVTVFNLLGQQLISRSANANQFVLDLSGLTRGSYLVKIETANGSKTVKIIKE